MRKIENAKIALCFILKPFWFLFNILRRILSAWFLHNSQNSDRKRVEMEDKRQRFPRWDQNPLTAASTYGLDLLYCAASHNATILSAANHNHKSTCSLRTQQTWQIVSLWLYTETMTAPSLASARVLQPCLCSAAWLKGGVAKLVGDVC